MPGVIYDLQGNCLFRRIVTTPFARGGIAGRGEIKGFSPSSASRMRRYLRTCEANYEVMVTLTYPFTYPVDGRTCKEQLRRFLQELGRYAIGKTIQGQPFSAFWFIEFQERGAPHFHIFTNCKFPKEWIARRWYGIVGSDDARHLVAGTRIEAIRAGRHGARAYAGKYAAKQQQKEVPHGFALVGRFWGVSGHRKCSAATILFPDYLVESQVYEDFRTELKRILQERRSRTRILRLRGLSSGAHVGNDQAVDEIKLLILRTGAALAARGAMLVEFPLLGDIGDDP